MESLETFRGQSLLTVELLEVLRRHGCYSVMDLLDRDQESLTNVSQIPPHIIRKIRTFLLDQLATRGRILSQLADYGSNHDEGFEQSVIFGVEPVDSLLQGEFRTGQILEVCGPPLTRKTQLLFRLTASTLQTNESCRILYVDTSGQFSPECLYNLLQSRGCTSDKTQQMLGRVEVSLVSSCERLLQFLDICVTGCADHSATRGSILLIMDSVHGVLSPLVGGQQSSSEPSMLNAVGQALGFLSATFGVTVVYTNSASSRDGTTYSPGLGSYWRSVPHHRLLLTSLSDCVPFGSSLIKTTLLKSISLPCFDTVEFRLGQG